MSRTLRPRCRSRERPPEPTVRLEGAGIRRSTSPRASGPIHFRSCLEVTGEVLTGATGFGGAPVGEDMGWPP
jgi:hypothetical protein